jgi:hypothetical protein
MIRPTRLAALVAACLALFWAPPAPAWTASETLVTDTLASADSYSTGRPGGYEFYWFEIDITAIATGTAQLQIEMLRPDGTWALWYNGTAHSTVTAEQICFWSRSLGSETTVNNASCDIELELPMPGMWRVFVNLSGTATGVTYTVTHARF